MFAILKAVHLFYKHQEDVDLFLIVHELPSFLFSVFAGMQNKYKMHQMKDCE